MEEKKKAINLIVPPDKVTTHFVLEVRTIANKKTKNTILSFIGGFPGFNENEAIQGMLLGNYLLDFEQLKQLAENLNKIIEELEEK